MPEEKTFYERLTERWQNNKLVATAVFLIFILLAGITSFEKIETFISDRLNKPNAVFSEKVEFSFDEKNLLISLTVVNTTKDVVFVQEEMGCAAYQTFDGAEVPVAIIENLRERFLTEDAGEIAATDVEPGIIGILVAQVMLGNDLITPGNKEIITFSVRMPDGYGEEFSIDAHESIIGCEFWVGRAAEEQRIALLPKFNQAALD